MSAQPKSTSGSVVLRVILIVVAIAAAVLGVLYFTSDVYRTSIRAAADQYAHWTAENIAKDPEHYLAFCEEEANKALISLKASEISIAMNRAKLELIRDESKAKTAVGEKAMIELKDLFSKTDAAKAWPADWQGQKRDKDFMKQQIVSLHKQVASQKSLLTKIDAAVKQLDAQVTRVQNGRAQTQEQLAEIKTSREVLKVQRLTDELTSRLVSIKAVLQATISAASESSAPVSLDQLTAQAGQVVDTAEFDKIMGE